MSKPRLILFDIDATLLVTGGVGVRAMEQAGRDLFNPDFASDGIDFAGRIDPLLIDELMSRNGVAPTPDRRRAFRENYARRLPSMLQGSTTVRALPGVHDLLAALAASAAAQIGLLTGNFPETGRMKLEACGIDADAFVPAVWGDDSPHDPPARDHLPPVAIARFRERFGTPVEPSAVTVIGDTPHDIRCAHASGCRSLAVATGKFSIDQLRAAGAGAVLPDLSRTDLVLELLRAT